MEKSTYQKIRREVSFDFSATLFAAQVGCDLLILASALLCFAQSGWASLGGAALMAVFYFRAFSQMHEAVHNCLVPSKKLNDALGVMYGALCGLPFEQWKASHLKHHFWAGNIEQDPVMAIVKNYPYFSKRLIKSLQISWFLWIPLLALLQNVLFWKLSFKQPSKSKMAKLSLITPVVVISALFAVSVQQELALYFSLSIYLYMMAIEVVNFPHHLQLPYLKDEQKLPLWEQHQIARSCLYPKWFAQWVVLNFNYHSEHHMYPDAPWHALPALHEKIKLHVELNTDPQFEFILRNHHDGFDQLFTKKEKPPKAA